MKIDGKEIDLSKLPVRHVGLDKARLPGHPVKHRASRWCECRPTWSVERTAAHGSPNTEIAGYEIIYTHSHYKPASVWDTVMVQLDSLGIKQMPPEMLRALGTTMDVEQAVIDVVTTIHRRHRGGGPTRNIINRREA